MWMVMQFLKFFLVGRREINEVHYSLCENGEISLIQSMVFEQIFYFKLPRRKVEDDLPTLDWDEALSREDVNALIICTENDTHEGYAR